jgi:hypothetical protein
MAVLEQVLRVESTLASSFCNIQTQERSKRHRSIIRLTIGHMDNSEIS